MDRDRNGLFVLDRALCRDLLARVPIVRVGLAINAIPVALPVNFVLDRDEIIIRCNEGSKLDAALANATVAVEADEYDPVGHTGWSVVVKGRAREITRPDELDRAKSLGLRTWANDRTDHYIAISTDLVSGRSIGPPPSPDTSLTP
jgi:uncharacterized protein